MKNKVYREGVILGVIAGLLYGFGGVTAKFCKSGGMETFAVTFLRNLLALPVLFAFIKFKGYNLKVTGKQLGLLGIGGILLSCVTPVLLYSSFDYISVGLTFCIHYIYPVLIALINYLLFKEKLSKQKIMAMAFAVIGIWVILFSASAINLKGIICALLSGVSYTTYVIFIDKTGIRSLPGAVVCFYCTISSTIVLFFMCLIKGQDFMHPGWGPYGWIFATALLVICLGNAITPEAIKRAGAATVSILGILEPIMTTVISVIFLKEAITSRSLIGGILVLISATLILTEKEK